jgi:phosphoribosylformylglycinamidine synthase
VSHGGLAVTLAEMVHEDAGAEVSLSDAGAAELFHEQPGRAVIETTDPEAVREAFKSVAPVTRLGTADGSGALSLTNEDEPIEATAAEIAEHRSVIEQHLD